MMSFSYNWSHFGWRKVFLKCIYMNTGEKWEGQLFSHWPLKDFPSFCTHAVSASIIPRHIYSESAGIKQNQPEWRIFKICATFGREFQTRHSGSFRLQCDYSHTRGGMSRNDVGMEIIYIFLDMLFGGVLNYVRTHSRANRPVPTAFEPHSSGNRKIPTAFELHSSWILLISK